MQNTFLIGNSVLKADMPFFIPMGLFDVSKLIGPIKVVIVIELGALQL